MKKAGIKNAESVADHCFRMALIGACVSEDVGLDSEKVMRMCLIHDLAESVIGDLMPEEKTSEKSHRDCEDAVMRGILGRLPRKASRKLLRDWNELRAGRTREARAVWQIDRLEMGFQMKEYSTVSKSKALDQFDPSAKLTHYFRKMLDEYS